MLKRGFWLIGSWFVFLVWMNASQCTQADPRLQQYKVEGEQLYLAHCANCHQADGKGLRLVYPPLAPSDYMDKNFESVVCGMKYGLSGEIVVNGNAFRQSMPGVPSLTELELAEIATYIYNSWGHQRGLVEVGAMAVILDSCRVVSGSR